jgi:hypothetical protein
MVPPMAPLESRSSGSNCWLADQLRARSPRAIDSTRVATPRASGNLAHFLAHSGASLTSSLMSPSGVRTATAQVEAPRIMTPSMTA